MRACPDITWLRYHGVGGGGDKIRHFLKSRGQTLSRSRWNSAALDNVHLVKHLHEKVRGCSWQVYFAYFVASSSWIKIFFSTKLQSHFCTTRESQNSLIFTRTKSRFARTRFDSFHFRAVFPLSLRIKEAKIHWWYLFVVPFDTLQLFLTCLIERTLKQHNVYIGCVNVNHHRRAFWRDTISYIANFLYRFFVALYFGYKFFKGRTTLTFAPWIILRLR